MIATPKPKPPTAMCECEHQSHFQDSHYRATGHAYGCRFEATSLVKVPTPVGHFTVCPACAGTCYHPRNFS